MSISRELGRAGEGTALGNLGAAFGNLGQYDKAIEFLTKELNISRELGDRTGVELAKNNLEIAKRNLKSRKKCE